MTPLAGSPASTDQILGPTRAKTTRQGHCAATAGLTGNRSFRNWV